MIINAPQNIPLIAPAVKVDAPEFRRGEQLSARKLNEIGDAIEKINQGVNPPRQKRAGGRLLEHSVTWLQGVGPDGAALDMPDNGTYFDAFRFPKMDMLLTEVYAYFDSYTNIFSCQLYVNSIAVGSAFNQNTTYPYILDTPVFVEKGQKIALRCISSSNVTGFQATAILFPKG